MMSTQLLEKLIRETGALSVPEKLRLAAHLLDQASEACPEPHTPLKWRDIRGLMPYPLAGEDAQAWVSRTRRESDEHPFKRVTELNVIVLDELEAEENTPEAAK